MDYLRLDTIAFPVRSAELYRSGNTATDYRWGIEINCEESPGLDYRSWPEDREEGQYDWLAGAEPYLYAQMLPLGAASPDELVGRVYLFPQSAADDPPDWPEGLGGPFFCLYLFEHYWAYPISVAFTGKRGQQDRVETTGNYPGGEMVYDLRGQAWLEWKE